MPSPDRNTAKALTVRDSAEEDAAFARGRMVYSVMTAHVLSGLTAQRVHLIDHAIIFGDTKLFRDYVIKHFHAYAKFRGCDCGAALRVSQESFRHMVTPKDFVTNCVCTHDYAHIKSIVSPDFFGTKISPKSRLLGGRDDRSLASTSSSEVEDSDAGGGAGGILYHSPAYTRCPSPAHSSADRTGYRRASIPSQISKPKLETWLREADYFRRISFDAQMHDLLDRLFGMSIDVDTQQFLRELCESGRLFAELAVQHFTRLDSADDSLLLRFAHTRVAKYIVSIWHPDKEHDFVYRATLRQAIATDNVHAFRLLSPTLFYMHQRQYRAPKYLLADLVHKKCWKILSAIKEGDLLGKQLRKAKAMEEPVNRSPSGFAQYLRIPETDQDRDSYKVSVIRVLFDVTNSLEYSVLLNEARDEGTHFSAAVFEYLQQYLPAPDWLSERDGSGYGSLLTKYYPSLSPNAVHYVLREVQPGSANWRDCVKRSLSDSLRWGKHGREKLLLLCDHEIELSFECFDAINAQREYWKLSDEDLEKVRGRVV